MPAANAIATLCPPSIGRPRHSRDSFAAKYAKNAAKTTNARTDIARVVAILALPDTQKRTAAPNAGAPRLPVLFAENLYEATANVSAVNAAAKTMQSAHAAHRSAIIQTSGMACYFTSFESSSMQRSFCSGFPIVILSQSGSP